MRNFPIVLEYIGKFSFFWALIFLATFWSSPISAAQIELTPAEHAWIKDHPVVQVGIDADYAPYSFLDKDREFVGIAPELLKLIAELTGLRFEPVPGLDWPGILDGARNGTLDLIATAVRNPERDDFLAFTNIYIPTPLVIMNRKGDNRIGQPGDLAGKTVALVEGYSSTRRVLSEYPDVIPKFVATAGAGLRALAIGEADAYVGVLGVNVYLAREAGLINLKIASRYDDLGNGQRLGIRKDWPELAGILQKALDAIPRADTVAIFDRWAPLIEAGRDKNSYPEFELTEKEQAWLSDRDQIRIGMMNNWPPLDYVDDQGKLRGIGIGFLDAINRRIGGRIEVVPGPWNKIYNAVKSGELDAVTGITPRESRDKNFNFTAHYVIVPHAIFARSDARFLRSLSDLSGKTVATERGFFINDVLRKTYPKTEILTYKNTSDALDAVAKGEVDAYVGNRAVAMYIIDNELISNVKEHGRITDTSSINAIGVRKDWPILRDILQKALDNITPAERRVILKDWVAPEDASRQPFTLDREEKAWLVEHPVIRVAADRDWPPVEFIGGQGHFVGVAPDYLRRISALLGVRFEFDTKSNWTQAVDKLRRRELDMFSAAAATTERQEFARFTAPYLTLPAVIFKKRPVAYGITLRDLNGKRVAVVKGYAIAEFLRGADWGIELVEVSDVRAGIDLLQSETVDAYVGSTLVTGHHIRQAGFTNLVVSGQTPYSIGVALASRSDWPIFTKLLRRAVDHFSESHRAGIIGTWVGLEYTEPPDYELMLQISLGIAVLLLALSIWIWTLRRKSVRQTQALASQNQALIHEVEERTLAEFVAQNANRTKSELLANLSHEFRTPLNAVIGYAEMLKMGIGGSSTTAKGAEYLEAIRSAGSHLLQLVNDTLDLSAIEADGIKLDESEETLDTIFADVWVLTAPISDAANIGLVWPPETDQKIMVDRRRIVQILTNLVDNAIKFSATGQKIVISFTKNSERGMIIAVRDSGPGISKSQIAAVFAPFNRGNNPYLRATEGAGLGLSLSENLARMHNGALLLTSEPGEGTTASLILPRERVL